MKVTVEIDPRAGFCRGVVRAVYHADKYLNENGSLYSLGSIVHNSYETERLNREGLRIIGYDEFGKLKNTSVLIRAHGEPPSTYATAKANGIKLIDCTCPAVLALQKKIRLAYSVTRKTGGQIVIFGKREHAEVNGLAGQVGGDAIVIQSESDIGRIDFSKPVELFSQTTRDPEEYGRITGLIRSKNPVSLVVHDTICRNVRSRYMHLPEFAASHNMVLFVAGADSSNGRVLYDLCREVNPRTFLINNAGQIDKEWFANGDSVGISGATSTPATQLQEVADTVRKLFL
ncbi:MAG: 4-hydroxy-3-methylbut-2-enyl diphosphate reductase [Bacteroidales bacterium]|nr:4-hydroxy-3-methylbut-2-enyl diphosphate reductase [Bacteroidales bacterium]MCI2122464.1 4-hydroxy-3-methylbut-2-enyl diphosphate reductase [Bacteroidales bacterium]MCI2145446.1 4-hydroxy-3-methylbut-2-enyl diphosphate reductase [Bacteroidales bacterium]